MRKEIKMALLLVLAFLIVLFILFEFANAMYGFGYQEGFKMCIQNLTNLSNLKFTAINIPKG